jgi:hypothetical protein
MLAAKLTFRNGLQDQAKTRDQLGGLLSQTGFIANSPTVAVVTPTV